MDNKKSISIEVKKEWCKGCELCVNFCPKKVLIMEQRKVRVN